MSKELVPVIDDPKSYLAIQQDPQQLLEAVQVNLTGETLTAFDLDRVKMASGGLTKWIVPTLEGEDTADTVSGVIVSNRLTRSMWREDEPDSSPPDCSSPDSIFGFGDPGDSLRAQGKGCEDCPLSQFGSLDEGDDDENRQKCKQSRQLFLLDPEEMMPKVVQIPPSSLKNAKQFLTRLTMKAVPYWAVVVEIGLEKAESAGGVAYAKATFKTISRLDPDTTAKVKAYSDALAPMLEKVAVNDAGGGAVFNPDDPTD